MKKNKRLAGSLIVIVVLTVVAAISVLGISMLVRSIAGDGDNITNEVDSESGESSGNDNEGGNSGEPVHSPISPENRMVEIYFENDVLTINNPGDEYYCRYTTNINELNVELHDRESSDFGEYEASNSTYFSSYGISEEKNHTKLTFVSEKPFNIIETNSGATLKIEFVDPRNSDNIEYRNDLDRCHMWIRDAELSMRSDSEVLYYSENYDAVKLMKKITIPKENMPALKDEKVILNDGYLDYYEIRNSNDDVEFYFSLSEELTIYPNTRDHDATWSFIKDRSDENLIVLDAGHGGIDGGAVSKGEVIIEKNVVLNITSMLEKILEERGFNVYNLREEDVFLGLKERTDIANYLKADSIISIHVNSYTDTSVNGTLTMYKDSFDLAVSIQNNLVATLKSTDIGAVKMEDRSILNGAYMDSVIVEIGFLTNELEAEKLNTEEYQMTAALGIADGITAYYEKRTNEDE